MAEHFKVSAAYIILYLKDIEKKLQRTDHSQYPLPHYIGGEIPVEALNNEAKKMMDFVGLTSFTPDCCWEETNNATAGYIELDGSRFGPIRIHLSSRYKCNGHATIAILAHEICHKLLEYHGLYFPQLPKLNETYTDLCTIYVGFTQLIVNGYKTTVGNVTFTLGYLPQETFEQTIAIIDLIQGRRPFDQQWADGADVFSNFARWIIEPDKRKCHIDGFAKRQLVYAGLNKRVSLLIRLLRETLSTYNPTLKEIDLDYFFENSHYGNEETVKKMPIKLFCMSHPEFFSQQDELKAKEADRLSLRLDRVIRDLVKHSKDEKVELQSNIHACPFCMNEFTVNKDGQEWKVIKCKKCGNRFALDLTDYRLLEESLQPQTPTSTAPNKKWWQFWK